MAELIIRARAMGKRLWSPEVDFDHHSMGFVQPLCELMLSAGMALGETGANLKPRDLLAAVEQGMREARVEYARVLQSHAQRAQCEPDGLFPMCDYCRAYAQSVTTSQASRRRWAQETEAPDRKYAVTDATWGKHSAQGKIHERHCSVVTREIEFADRALESLSPYEARHGGVTVGWPHLLTQREAEMQNRHRCRVCSPDLPDRVTKTGLGRAPSGQFYGVKHEAGGG